jgi:hypothetical protein
MRIADAAEELLSEIKRGLQKRRRLYRVRLRAASWHRRHAACAEVERTRSMANARNTAPDHAQAILYRGVGIDVVWPQFVFVAVRTRRKSERRLAVIVR